MRMRCEEEGEGGNRQWRGREALKNANRDVDKMDFSGKKFREHVEMEKIFTRR